MTFDPYWQNSSNTAALQFRLEQLSGTNRLIFKADRPITTLPEPWPNPMTATTSIPMGWKEAESQDTTVRVEKAKKKRVANEKEIKRLTMGPKASRWR
jgi:hypothetical protein